MSEKTQYFLDMNKQYLLEFGYDSEKKAMAGRLMLNKDAFHADARVERNLHKLLKFKLNNRNIVLDENADKSNGVFASFKVDVPDNKAGDINIKLGNQVFAEYSFDPSNDKSPIELKKEPHGLTAFEIRCLAKGDDIYELPYIREDNDRICGYTDLHTHSSAANSSKPLLEMAFNKEGKDIIYPSRYLDMLGIKYDEAKLVSDGREVGIPLRRENFDEDGVKKLIFAMHIPVDKQITFFELEDIYNYRTPITKNDDMFLPMLEGIAKEYQAQGVQYAEMTLTKMLDPKWVQVLNDNMPRIEAETGVSIRYLAGLIRHMDEPTNMYNIEKLKVLSKTPYIVGVDFIGHETNPTKEILPQMEELAKWIKAEKPDFILRVHAGESDLCDENVNDALKVAKKYGIRMRIGHGLYGVTDETLKLFKETDAIAEFNPHSNLSLNNIDSVEELPIRRYFNAGVKCVISQDGGGIYQSDARQEVLVARFAGASRDDLRKVRELEKNHIIKQTAIFNKEMQKEDALVVDFDKVPSGEKFIAQSRKLQAEKLKHLNEEHRKIRDTYNFSEHDLDVNIKGKTPILLSGSASSIDKMSANEVNDIRASFVAMEKLLDSSKVYFVTSGAPQGVEKILLDELADNGNFTVVAAIAKNTKASSLYVSKAVSNAIFVGNNIPERSFEEIKYIKKKNGSALFIGGGTHTSDQIQLAINQNLDCYLLEGPDGASTKKNSLNSDRDTNKGMKRLLTNFFDKRPNLFKEGVDAQLIRSVCSKSYVKIASLDIQKTISERKKRSKDILDKHKAPNGIVGAFVRNVKGNKR